MSATKRGVVKKELVNTGKYSLSPKRANESIINVVVPTLTITKEKEGYHQFSNTRK